MTDAATIRRSWGRNALLFVILFEALGWLSGYVSQSGYGNDWFDALVKPSFMPPGWAFGLVWPILYALLGIAVARILALPPSPERRAALILFFVQMALNFSWSPLFFAAHDIGLAKYVILAMAVIAALAAGKFYRLDRPAGLMMVPYLAWLVFAATLNSAIDALNPGAGASLLGI